MIMMRGRLVVIATLIAATGVHAAKLPDHSRYDKRIQYVDYNEGDVVVVRSTPGIGTRIVFDAKETIQDMASGFSDGWELVNRANILYLKPRSIKVSSGAEGDQIIRPIARDWDTNLMVRTDKRLYDFDLHLITSRGSSGVAKGATYRVQFRYPELDLRNVQKSVETNNNLPSTNWLYNMRVAPGSEGIAPAAAFDDGRFTYLRFPNNREIPSVFLQASDESESLVNSHMNGDTLVIHRVAPVFVLRLGEQVVGIYNAAYDIDGIPTPTGTSVPGLVRTIKGNENGE